MELYTYLSLYESYSSAPYKNVKLPTLDTNSSQASKQAKNVRTKTETQTGMPYMLNLWRKYPSPGVQSCRGRESGNDILAS